MFKVRNFRYLKKRGFFSHSWRIEATFCKKDVVRGHLTLFDGMNYTRTISFYCYFCTSIHLNFYKENLVWTRTPPVSQCGRVYSTHCVQVEQRFGLATKSIFKNKKKEEISQWNKTIMVDYLFVPLFQLPVPNEIHFLSFFFAHFIFIIFFNFPYT